MADNAIIKLEHVDMWYDQGKESEVHALNDINIEICAGEYAAFFGPSGCGKTSMLYAISGIDRVQNGKILVNNRDLAQMSNQELAIFRQAGIGIVFQQFNLVPSLSVLQNVALPMSFVGISKQKAEEEAKKLVDRLSLTQYANRFPHELSGGQQQRVGIARALANNPPIIIADEPLGNLDSINAKNVLAFFKELNVKDGRTIIMVTHEAWSLQDVTKIFHMKDGVVLSTEIVEPKEIVPLHKLAEREADNSEHIAMTARILSNFLMRGYSVESIIRFEEFLKLRFEDKIDALKFRELLQKPYKEGGVGLWRTKAERISTNIENIIDKRRDVAAIVELAEKNPEFSIQDEVRNVRQYVLQEYTGRLSELQALALDELIADRIRHFITADQFMDVLHRSLTEFGAGFPLRTVQKISDRLETVLDASHQGGAIWVPTVA